MLAGGRNVGSLCGPDGGQVLGHAEQYADLDAEGNSTQQLRVDAFAAYVNDVATCGFSHDPRLVPIDDGELASVRSAIGG